MNKHGIKSDINNNVVGKTPPGAQAIEKKCALTKALKLAQSCSQKLNIIKEDLQALCCNLNLNDKKVPSTPANSQTDPTTPEGPSERAVMTGHLLTLIGEAQTIAKRIYETAVGLHVAEDYLRQPDDLKLLDFSCNGRIQIPNYNFNHASQLCLEWLHSTANKWLRGFKEQNGDDNSQFIKVFENFTKAVKDYTEAVCLANQVFRVLLYPNTYGKETLQEYVLALGHVLKNDMIMEVQALRRAFDGIQYSFERLGWAASIAWMKYSGQKITVETLNENGIQVDHSTFQHKFYEGPSKLKKKVKIGGASGGGAANKLKAKDVPSSAESKTLGKSSSTKTSNNNLKKNSYANSEESNTRGKAEIRKENSSDKLPVSRESGSLSEDPNLTKTSDIMGKVFRDDMSTGSSDTNLSDRSLANLKLLQLLKGEKSYYLQTQSDAGSKSNVEELAGSGGGEKTKAEQGNSLTIPSNIPAAWRKQFGAVFGAHLVPPKTNITKKIKKKAGGGRKQKGTKKLGAESPSV